MNTFRHKREKPSSGDDSRFKSRLDEVQYQVAKKAEFWDRTSIVVFLGMVALAGLMVFLVGLASYNQGQMTIPLFRTTGFNGTQFQLFCFILMSAGLNFMIPLPLTYFLKPRTVVIITASFMAVNFVVFSYTFVVQIIREIGVAAGFA